MLFYNPNRTPLQNYNDWLNFLKRKPIIAILLTIVIIFEGFRYFEIATLKSEKTDLQQRNQLLEIQLTPIRTYALQQFPSLNAAVALQKLIDEYKKLNQSLDELKTYKYASNLDKQGLFTGGDLGGVRQSTKITELLGSAISRKKDGLYCDCSQEGEGIFKEVIQKQPSFPFSYYCLALCKRKNNSSEWKTLAQKALEILNITTKIDGHFIEHDEAKKELIQLLRGD